MQWVSQQINQIFSKIILTFIIEDDICSRKIHLSGFSKVQVNEIIFTQFSTISIFAFEYNCFALCFVLLKCDLFTFQILKSQEKTWQLRMFLSCSWWYGFWLVKIKCKNWRTAKWLVEITVCCCFSNDVIEFLSWNGVGLRSLRS